MGTLTETFLEPSRNLHEDLHETLTETSTEPHRNLHVIFMEAFVEPAWDPRGKPSWDLDGISTGLCCSFVGGFMAAGLNVILEETITGTLMDAFMAP